MKYYGLNRRVHTCFITHNREYHTRKGVCVAVRDRGSSIWISGHDAVGLPMKPLPPGAVYLGNSLEFLSNGKKVITSRVVDIVRPGKSQVSIYGLVYGFYPA